MGRRRERVFGGWGWVPVEPNRGEEVRLHFLPFPQEGTHTSLNLTPKAAAWRLGAADRPHWLPPPHAWTRLLGVAAGGGGRWLRRYLLGFGMLASRVPGIQATRLPLPRAREALRPTGAQGDSILIGLLSFSCSRGKGGTRRQAKQRCPGKGLSGLQKGAARLRRRPGSALRAMAEGSQDHLFPLPPASSNPPLPPSPGGGSPACICRRGGSSRRLAWPRPPQPGSPPQAKRRSLSAAALPSPFLPVGPQADLGPPSPVSLSSPFSFFPPSPRDPPPVCSRLWGWARDVKHSVASARLAGAGHQKSNVLFPNYPLSVREQGRTGWELNVKYPLQAGSIAPGIQPQPRAALPAPNHPDLEGPCRAFIFPGWSGEGVLHASAARLGCL